MTTRAIGDAEIVDLRPALSNARHSDAGRDAPIWGATHVRAALELAWQKLDAIAHRGSGQRYATPTTCAPWRSGCTSASAHRRRCSGGGWRRCPTASSWMGGTSGLRSSQGESRQMSEIDQERRRPWDGYAESAEEREYMEILRDATGALQRALAEKGIGSALIGGTALRLVEGLPRVSRDLDLKVTRATTGSNRVVIESVNARRGWSVREATEDDEARRHHHHERAIRRGMGDSDRSDPRNARRGRQSRGGGRVAV